MLTGRFDPIAQGETWIWAHDIIADDTGDLMGLGGCVFTINIARRSGCIIPDYGFVGPAGVFYSPLGPLPYPIAVLASGNGVLTVERGTIEATVPGAMTMGWPLGECRVTLDVSRNGETARLVDMILPVSGY